MEKNLNLIPRQVPIVGPPNLVRATLETQLRQGRLLTHPSDITLTRNADGTVTVFASLLVEQRLSWRKRNPLWFGCVVAAAMSAVLAGLAWLVYRAVTGLAHTLDGPTGMGALVITGAVLLALLANRSNHSGACPGIAVHCKCGRGHKR